MAEYVARFSDDGMTAVEADSEAAAIAEVDALCEQWAHSAGYASHGAALAAEPAWPVRVSLRKSDAPRGWSHV